MGCFLSEPANGGTADPPQARRPSTGGRGVALLHWVGGSPCSLPPASILPPITGPTCQPARRTPAQHGSQEATWQVCHLHCAWHLTFYLHSPQKSLLLSINPLSLKTQKPGTWKAAPVSSRLPPAWVCALDGRSSPSHRRRMPALGSALGHGTCFANGVLAAARQAET